VPVRISFVCLGNICRSPTAEAVMRHRVSEAGLQDEIVIESAGTGSWHVGSGPDPRARSEALGRGIAMGGRARQFDAADFARLDLVLAMDEHNAADLRALAPDAAAAAKVRLLREFDPVALAAGELSVPDPYYGGPDGFADVFSMVDAAAVGLLGHLRGDPSPPA
jgi:protein-tyrosine phosphatase